MLTHFDKIGYLYQLQRKSHTEIVYQFKGHRVKSSPQYKGFHWLSVQVTSLKNNHLNLNYAERHLDFPMTL